MGTPWKPAPRPKQPPSPKYKSSCHPTTAAVAGPVDPDLARLSQTCRQQAACRRARQGSWRRNQKPRPLRRSSRTPPQQSVWPVCLTISRVPWTTNSPLLAHAWASTGQAPLPHESAPLPSRPLCAELCGGSRLCQQRPPRQAGTAMANGRSFAPCSDARPGLSLSPSQILLRRSSERAAERRPRPHQCCDLRRQRHLSPQPPWFRPTACPARLQRTVSLLSDSLSKRHRRRLLHQLDRLARKRSTRSSAPAMPQADREFCRAAVAARPWNRRRRGSSAARL